MVSVIDRDEVEERGRKAKGCSSTSCCGQMVEMAVWCVCAAFLARGARGLCNVVHSRLW